MNRLLHLFVLLGGIGVLQAAPGDTTWVQTFSFDSIAVRKAKFDFPASGKSWRKVLAYYRLKCDPATPGDPYDCGEWDVNTYIRVYKKTGQIKTEEHLQPGFVRRGESPDSLRIRRTPVWNYRQRWSEWGPREADSYLQFRQGDFVEIPPAVFEQADSALTLSFWARGDSDQPWNGSLLEAGLNGARVVNIHLPWGTGEIFWDAGGLKSGNNNRLQKPGHAEDWKGRWTHWAFVKNLRTAQMSIYLDGKLWHSAGQMKKAIGPVSSFLLGSNCNGNGGWYKGALDDFCLFSRALSAEEIQCCAQQSCDPTTLPGLELCYRFNSQGAVIQDLSGKGNHARLFGEPQRLFYGSFGQSDWRPARNAAVQLDSSRAAAMTIFMYTDQENPRSITDTLRAWPAQSLLFDADGRLLKSMELEADTVLVQSYLSWQDEPREEQEVFELARYITPYGKGLDLGGDGFLWLLDLTDYAALLEGPVELQAGNGFELLDLRFALIEGPPAREVLRIRNIWPEGGYRYGDLYTNAELQNQILPVLPEAEALVIRSRISGHGHYGPDNCCEWARKEHHMSVNGINKFDWTLWTNCGDNPLYPQGGTWQFDRAGWCPGRFVTTVDNEIRRTAGADSLLALDYSIEAPLENTGEQDGSYYHSQQLLEVGDWQQGWDLELQEILVPSIRKEFRRMNPPCTQPRIRIRNRGRNPIHHIRFDYGMEGDTNREWLWYGNLGVGASEDIFLPACNWDSLAEGQKFRVTAELLEGPDGWSLDNSLTSSCPEPWRFKAPLIVVFEAPPFGRGADNYWLLLDAAGQLQQRRDGFSSATVNRDTLRLKAGAWEFYFHDREEDGLIRHWWLRGSDPDHIGVNGHLMLLSMDGDTLVDLGTDFAEGVSCRFFIKD